MVPSAAVPGRSALDSPSFARSNWRLFRSLVCRLAPQDSAGGMYLPEPLSAALGFDTVEAYVTGPVKQGGLALVPEKWAAVTRAAAAIAQAQ